MKKKKRKIILILTIIVIIAIGYCIYRNISIEKNNVDDYQDYTPQEEITEEQMRQTKVILYFENIETGELDTEIKVIDAKNLIENPYKELINLLIKGPQSSNLKKLIPEGTIVHEVTVENSCAKINLSQEFLNYENEEQKLKIINRIVNTVTNLKEISSVKFLINGEESEELKDVYVKTNE